LQGRHGDVEAAVFGKIIKPKQFSGAGTEGVVDMRGQADLIGFKANDGTFRYCLGGRPAPKKCKLVKPQSIFCSDFRLKINSVIF